MVRKQIQLSNCLGVSQEDVKTAVSGPHGFAVSNLHLKAPRHTTHMLLSTEISTSEEIYVTVTCPKKAIVPDSFLVPTISGNDKIISVTKMFEYENHRTVPPADLPVTSSDPRFRTRECIYPKHSCPHGRKCLFAHGPSEVRQKVVAQQPLRSSPHSVDMTAVNGVVPSSTSHLPSFIKTIFLQQPVVSVLESNNAVPDENILQPTPLTTTSTVLDSQSPLASDTVNPSEDEPFTMTYRGRSSPCGPTKSSLIPNLHVAPAAVNSTVSLLTTTSPAPITLNREPMIDLSASVPSTPFLVKSLLSGETMTHVSKKNAQLSANSPSKSGTGKSPVPSPSQPLIVTLDKKTSGVLMKKPSESPFFTTLNSPPNIQSKPGTSPNNRGSPPGLNPPKKSRTSPHHNRVPDSI